MVEFSIADRRYTFIHEFNGQPVDVHQILVQKSKAKGLFLCFAAFTLLANASIIILFLVKELHPPVKMLAPIWKALCVVSGIEENWGTSGKYAEVNKIRGGNDENENKMTNNASSSS